MVVSLDGKWQLYSKDPKNEDAVHEHCIDAIVPGDIHLDLLRNGLICEPLIGENSLNQTWIEEKDWWYHRTFHIEKNSLRTRSEIVFEGIDQSSDIFINGCHLGHTNNMFRIYRFDITGLLVEGINTIDVRVDVGLRDVNNKPTKEFEICWNTWDVRRFWSRKAQQSFYWDITPRLLTCGLWRSVYVESFDSVAIRDAYVTHTINNKHAELNVSVEMEVFDTNSDVLALGIVVNGKEQVNAKVLDILPVETGKITRDITLLLSHVRLWWPNGMGEQHLYSIEISLMNHAGKVISKKELRYGVRDISIIQESLNEKEKTFNFIVNGHPVFCKGWNWVPPDAIYARITPERYRELILTAVECNTNMLRVWGGGIYPDQSFFDLCDEMGIMVWQDFMFACGYYPDFDQAFCNEVQEEIDCIIRNFRNHASLVLWCGNNENQQVHETVNKGGVHIGKKIFDEIIPAKLIELDPNTLYRPTSPFGGDWSNSCKQGDQHIWDYSMAWLTNGTCQLKIWDFPNDNPKFMSEFGIQAPSNQKTAQQYMNGEKPDYQSRMWYHHMCYFAVGLIDNLLKKYYKSDPIENIAEYTLAGQMIQAEAVRDVIDTLHSRKFICGGVLYWQFAESWGHTGYSPVDYYLRKKVSYYYIRRAFAPVSIMCDEKNNIVILNDTLKDKIVHLKYGVKDFFGEDHYNNEKDIIIPSNGRIYVNSDYVGCSSINKESFFYAVLYEEGVEVARNRKFLAPLKDLILPVGKIRHTLRQVKSDMDILSLESETFQWCVHLAISDNLEYSDNAFDIWPGETKTVYIRRRTPAKSIVPKISSINYYKGDM